MFASVLEFEGAEGWGLSNRPWQSEFGTNRWKAILKSCYLRVERDPGARFAGFEPQPQHSVALWLWASQIASLCLSFPIRQMGTTWGVRVSKALDTNSIWHINLLCIIIKSTRYYLVASCLTYIKAVHFGKEAQSEYLSEAKVSISM